jgi:dihydropteroate synthase
MKRILTAASALAVMAMLAAPLHAGDMKFAQPILLTSCGQSADVLMLKTMLSKDSVKFDYQPNATEAEVAGKGSVIVVVGGSSKGLGAAKVSPEQETARVTALLAAVQKAGIPVMAIHMGGQNRRGALSDPFNALGAENCQRLIVVKAGNEDGFFTKIAEAKKIPMDTLNSLIEVGPLVKEIYKTTE